MSRMRDSDSRLDSGESSSGLAPDQLRTLVDHFERTFARHGPTARGVDWRTESDQVARIEILVAEIMRAPRASVCDLGCAYGPLLDALRAAGYQGRYIGVDASSDLIAAASARHHADPAATFLAGASPRPADFVVASGLFSWHLGVGRGEWRAHVDGTLARMVECASSEVLVNFLTRPTLPNVTPHLHYEDPDRVTGVLLAAGAADVRIVTRLGLRDFAAVADTSE